MALNNNINNEKVTHMLLIIALSLSTYETFTNTQLDNTFDDISTNLEKRLDMINESLYDTKAKIEYNTIDIMIAKNRLDSIEDDIKALDDRINLMNDRLTKIEAKIDTP